MDINTHATLKNNLVAYWTLDEDLTDVHAGHDGTFYTTGVPITFPVCKLRTGAALLGSPEGHYGAVPSHADFDSNIITLAGWIYVPSMPTASIIERYDGAMYRWTLCGSGGKLFWSATRSGIGKWSRMTVTAGWHHVIAYFKWVSSVEQYNSLWVDGVLATEIGGSNSSDWAMNAGDVQFGKGQVGWWSTNLNLDDIGIWTRELTAGERADLYQSGIGITYDGNFISISDHPTLMSGLLAYYSFENDATDDLGGFDGTPVGSPTYEAGKVGQAILLNGTTQWVDISSSSTLDPDKISLVAWVNLTAGSDANAHAISRRQGSDFSYVLARATVGGIDFAVQVGGVAKIRHDGWTNGIWEFYVGTYDGATVLLYRNAVALTGLSAPGTISKHAFTTVIGGTDSDLYPFKGDIDGAGIYNRALIQSEIDDLYNGGAGLAYLASVAPNVLSANATNSTTVRVTYDKEVKHTSESDPADSLNPDNYAFAGTVTITADSVSLVTASPTVVDITLTGEMTDGASYDLTVSNVEDLDDVGLNVNIASFTGVGVDPQVSSVVVIDSRKIQIVFNELMLHNAALISIGSYAFDGGLTATTPISAIDEGGVTKVEVPFTGSVVHGDPYLVTVSGVVDLALNPIDLAHDTGSFFGLNPELASAALVAYKVRATFNSEMKHTNPVDPADALYPAGYAISGPSTPEVTTVDLISADPTVVDLTIDAELIDDGEYNLQASCEHISGNWLEVDTAPFTGLGYAPRLINAVAVNALRILVQFNEAVFGATEAGNYTIAGLDVLGAELYDLAEHQYLLSTAAQTPEAEYTLEVGSGITDSKGLPIDPLFDSFEFTGYLSGSSYAAHLQDQGLIEAITGTIGEACTEMAGLVSTKLRQAVTAGTTAFPVESTDGWPDSGRCAVDGVPYTYSGKTLTTLTGIKYVRGGEEQTGAAMLHHVEALVTDISRERSFLEKLRRSLLLNYADGEDLNIIGRNLGVTRHPIFTEDDIYREVVRGMAYNPKGSVLGLELALTGMAGAGNFEVYEDLIRFPCQVFIQLTGEALIHSAQSNIGKAWMTESYWDALAGSANLLELAEAPLSVYGAQLKGLQELFDFRAEKPSAVTYDYYPGALTPGNAFSYAGSLTEGTAVIVEDGQTKFSCASAGTVFYRMLDTQGARITPESDWAVAIALYIPTAASLKSGEREQASLAIFDGNCRMSCGLNDDMAFGMFAIPGAFLGSTVTLSRDTYYTVELRKARTGQIELLVDGIQISQAAYSSFWGAWTPDHQIEFGIRGNPNSGMALWVKQLRASISTPTDFWSGRGFDGGVDDSAPSRFNVGAKGSNELFLDVNDLSGANWLWTEATYSTTPVLLRNGTTGTAHTFRENDANDTQHNVGQIFSIEDGVSYCEYWEVKYNGAAENPREWVVMMASDSIGLYGAWFNIRTGEFGLEQAYGITGGRGIIYLGDGWYGVWIWIEAQQTLVNGGIVAIGPCDSGDDDRILTETAGGQDSFFAANQGLVVGQYPTFAFEPTTHTFLESDVGKPLRTYGSAAVNAQGGNNNGRWRIATYVSSTAVTLEGIEHEGASTSAGTPTRITLPLFDGIGQLVYPDDLGKRIQINGSEYGDDGIYTITKIFNPVSGNDYATEHISGMARGHTCEVAGATFATEAELSWELLPNFVDEVGLSFEMNGAGTIAGTALTLREPLWKTDLIMEILAIYVHSAQLLLDQNQITLVTDEGPPPTYSYYPWYVVDPLGLLRPFIDQLTAAGVVPEYFIGDELYGY